MAHQTKSGGTPITLAKTGGRAAPPVRHKPSPPFVHFHHSANWFVKYGKVLPYLRTARIAPGINNVDQHGRWEQMRLSYERDGCVMIPEDIMGPGTSYIRRHAGLGGSVHENYCVRLYPGSSAMDTDHAEYERFLTAVAATVDPPPIYVIESMLEEAQQRANVAVSAARTAPELQAAADAKVAIVAVLEAKRAELLDALRAIEQPSAGVPVEVDAAPPKPKRKRRTIKKKPKIDPEVTADAG